MGRNVKPKATIGRTSSYICLFTEWGWSYSCRVSSEAKYEDAESRSEGFRVRYEWVEEEEVDLRSGSTVMFLVVSIASVVILLHTCSGKGTGPSQRENDSDNSSPYDTYGEQVNIASGAGKWD